MSIVGLTGDCEAEFHFPSERRRVLFALGVLALALSLPFGWPRLRRAASHALAAWQYRDARAVAEAYAAAGRDRDTSAIRRLAYSGSDSSTLCNRRAWPAATWQFARPKPRVTFEGVVGDYVAFFAHSVAERPDSQPVGLRMMLLREDPTRVIYASPRPALRDFRGC